MAALRYTALALSLVCLVTLTGAESPRPTRENPQLVLWAWERPESLTFLEPDRVAVAFLAETIYLDREPELRPRLQPLQVGPGTPLIAVVRLEVTRNTPAEFADAYTNTVSHWIAGVASLPQVQAVQIDFDATRSQHGFYRSLLTQVRPLLPPPTGLSITALGSWCMGDDWMDGLPIDEAIPMLFRMGVDRANILHVLQTGQDFRQPLCQHSVGLSTDEPWPEIRRGRRVYVFNPRSWTATSFQTVEQRLAP
jgi:hypothetical protein